MSAQGRGGPPPIHRTQVPSLPCDIVAGAPTATGIVVSVRCREDQTGTLFVGEAPDRLRPSGPRRTFPKGEPVALSLTGLVPGRRHHWQIRFDTPAAGAAPTLPPRSFATPPPPGVPFAFTVQADSHLDGGTEPDLYRRSLALARETDFLVDLGDTFMTDKYPDHRDALAQYLAQRVWFDQAQVPVLMVPGNHDGEVGWRPDMAAWARTTRRRFFPGPEETYWAHACGDALLIGLDPYTFTTSRPGGRGRGTGENWHHTLGRAQYAWLGKTLAASRARWKMVFVHNLVGGRGRDCRGGAEAAPLFEWGGRDLDGADRFAQRRPGWEAPIHTLLARHGVAVVFHGHDHLYARQERDGVVYQCVPQPGHGGGGGFRSAREYGYVDGTILDGSGVLRVEVSARRLEVVFQRVDRGDGRAVAHRYALS